MADASLSPQVLGGHSRGAEQRAHSRLSQSMSSVLDSEGLVVKTTRALGAAALRLSISSCVRYQCACRRDEHASESHRRCSIATLGATPNRHACCRN